MADAQDKDKPVSLFYSYSHKDEALRRELEGHLAVLRRGGLISEWHDRMIGAGDDWKGEIDRSLVTADIVLLLVSADFIASDYCWGEEMTKALERHDRGEARVIPIILRHCRWLSTPLARLQAVPRDARPVTAWLDRDEAFDDVVAAIERTVAVMRAEPEPEPAPKPKSKPEPAPEPSSGPADFAVFRDLDAPWCPEMVALPAGEFLMGSPEDEEGRKDWEVPQHRVTIGTRFAVGRFPITVGEYRRFMEATGRSHDGGIWYFSTSFWTGEPKEKFDERRSWRDPGFHQSERHPVVGVSWEDAQAYVAWLARETGKPYRLPSEAEWEYACRAGTTTLYAFGDEITESDANFGHIVGATTEVGAYPANPWGLFDMHGNVLEWVEDVWHVTDDWRVTYKEIMAGAGPLPDGFDDDFRVNRGGCWGHLPWKLRSASRNAELASIRWYCDGFRVARTLD